MKNASLNLKNVLELWLLNFDIKIQNCWNFVLIIRIFYELWLRFFPMTWVIFCNFVIKKCWILFSLQFLIFSSISWSNHDFFGGEGMLETPRKCPKKGLKLHLAILLDTMCYEVAGQYPTFVSRKLKSQKSKFHKSKSQTLISQKLKFRMPIFQMPRGQKFRKLKFVILVFLKISKKKMAKIIWKFQI